MKSAESRITLITGATRGLGLEVASQLARAGQTVILTGRDGLAAERRAANLREAGGDAHGFAFDVRSSAAARDTVQAVGHRFGRVDVLVNNAGIMLDGGWVGNTSATVPEEALRETFETNFFAVVRSTRAMLQLLRRGRDPHVINVSSVMGSLSVHADSAGPLAGLKPFAYDASKAALNAFTVHLAEAVAGDGIRVNSIHPGWVRTGLGTDAAPLGVHEGAAPIVELAISRGPGPTAKFLQAGGEVSW